MKLVAVVRTTETQSLEVTGADYAEAKAALEAALPVGFAILSIRSAAE